MKTKDMEMDHRSVMTEHNMREIGRKTKDMEKAHKFFQTEKNMKEIGG